MQLWDLQAELKTNSGSSPLPRSNTIKPRALAHAKQALKQWPHQSAQAGFELMILS